MSGDLVHGPFSTTSQELFAFIANHTESDSTIVFFKPRAMRLLTGRQSISVNVVEQIFRGDYLCIYLRIDGRGQIRDSEVESLLAQGVARFIYANDDFAVYRLIRRPEARSPLPSSLGISLRRIPGCEGCVVQSARPLVSTRTLSA
jgi:hypothetical protein